MKEVLEDHISPGDLSKKYNISAHKIRDWIKKAGYQLPKSYRRRGLFDVIYFVFIQLLIKKYSLEYCKAPK